MKETGDKHAASNQKLSDTNLVNISGDIRPPTEQTKRQEENKTKKNNHGNDENLTALYWG